MIALDEVFMNVMIFEETLLSKNAQ